jgi:hypothetical protein
MFLGNGNGGASILSAGTEYASNAVSSISSVVGEALMNVGEQVVEDQRKKEGKSLVQFYGPIISAFLKDHPVIAFILLLLFVSGLYVVFLLFRWIICKVFFRRKGKPVWKK